jgi:predicted heme/steroid binding protein
MTLEELATYDGQEGRKAWVAVNGNVYDFTASPLWQKGDHQNLHRAGADLTEELQDAPHVRAVIERYPVVGQIEEDEAEEVEKGGKVLLAAIVIAVLGGALALLLR